MFGLLENVVKGTIGVALTPVALVKDTVLAPITITDSDKEHPYEDTEKCFDATTEAISDIFDPDKW